MIPNYDPVIYNDLADIERLNDLLDQVTERPFLSPQVAVNAVRAALEQAGILLPKLDVERLIEGPNTLEAASYLATGQRIPASSYDCEYLMHLTDSDHIEDLKHELDEDWDDRLYFYFVMDRNEKLGIYEVYAQILDEEDVNEVVLADIPAAMASADLDLPDDEDVSGEDPYLRQVRHTGTGGFSGEA